MRSSILSWLVLLILVAACERHPWATPLVGGYQILMMGSHEDYVANAQNELILGPEIEAIGIVSGVIVVNCGLNEVVHGSANGGRLS